MGCRANNINHLTYGEGPIQFASTKKELKKEQKMFLKKHPKKGPLWPELWNIPKAAFYFHHVNYFDINAMIS